MQLQFMDCSVCGKRIATTAATCHHCHSPNLGSSLLPTSSLTRPKAIRKQVDFVAEEDYDADSEQALGYGGYDDEAMHEDDDAASKHDFSKLWRTVAWVLLVVFAASALVPWFW